MSTKPVPSQISNEELFEALNDGNPTEKPTEHSVLKFLADFNIIPGDSRVHARTLYKLYYYHSSEPVTNKEFYTILLSYFKTEEVSRRNFYYVNQQGSHLAKLLAEYLTSRKVKKKAKNPHFRKHFESFLESHGLQQGTYNIPAQALFYFYDKWQYESKLRTRLTYSDFLAMSKIYFNHKRTTKHWCILKINQDFIDSRKIELYTALEWGNKFNGKKKDIFKKRKKTK